ncbi:MAG: nucleotidyltransferase domain-containing protein [Nitrospirae bacterium]|nr:nucleotidyltransferase domain-containing protein [Nitrospirota bacterium]
MIEIPGLDQNRLRNICKEDNLSLVILFGSHSRGHADKNSDLDLAILADRKAINDDFEFSLLITFIHLIQKDNLDLVLLNRADPLLQFQIARYGTLLYEKSPGLFNWFKVQAMKNYDDAQKFIQLGEAYVQNFLRGKRSHGKQRCHPPQVS